MALFGVIAAAVPFALGLSVPVGATSHGGGWFRRGQALDTLGEPSTKGTAAGPDEVES